MKRATMDLKADDHVIGRHEYFAPLSGSYSIQASADDTVIVNGRRFLLMPKLSGSTIQLYQWITYNDGQGSNSESSDYEGSEVFQ